MEPLLYLCHRIPYPPDKGDKIRSFNWLKRLAQHYEVHLGAFVDQTEDWDWADELNRWCQSVHLQPIHPRWQRLRSLTALAGRQPLSIAYYRHKAMGYWVDQTVAQYAIRRGLAFSSTMAPYLKPTLHRVVDLVDVDSYKWQQFSQQHGGPLRWLYHREYRTLAATERAIVAEFDGSVLISDAECSVFRQQKELVIDDSRLQAIGNGIDCDYFDPTIIHANPYDCSGPVVVFTGAMDYRPNIEAVSWFVKQIWPAIRHGLPHSQFAIVGSRPSHRVWQLANAQQGVIVTGRVADIRPYLAHSQLVVAPLKTARGVQNKVLEAMAMNCPTVATQAAMDGIDLPMDWPFAVVDSPQEFSQACLNQLQTQCQSRIGRRWVEQRYAWSEQFDKLHCLLTPSVPSP